MGVPDWTLQISYFGLVPWLLIATPLVLTAGQLPALIKRDTLTRAHVAFIGIQFIGLANSASNFGVEGLIAGSYIICVSISFLYIYAFGLRLGEMSAAASVDRTSGQGIKTLTAAIIPTVAIGVLQVITQTGRDVDGVMRIYGGTSSPNVMGALLLIYIIIMTWGYRYKLNLINTLFIYTCLSLFVYCFSMSGFASFIFAIIMYVVVRAWSTGTIKLRLSWVILGIIGLYILFALAGALLSMRINELSQEDNSLTWRIRTWLTYIELLSDPKFLLLGGGLGYDHLGPVQEPHNEWIRIIMETGLLGMSFFILIWWKLISILMQISKMADGLLQRRAAGLLAGTAGLLLWASVDSVIRTAPSALLLWAACGMLIGLARSYNERTAPIAKTGEASTPSSPSTAPA